MTCTSCDSTCDVCPQRWRKTREERRRLNRRFMTLGYRQAWHIPQTGVRALCGEDLSQPYHIANHYKGMKICGHCAKQDRRTHIDN